MRSPGRKAAHRHRAPSVASARARALAGRMLPGAHGAVAGGGASGGTGGATGRAPGGGPGRRRPARHAHQPRAAQAGGHPHVRRRSRRGRGRIPGRQHVADRPALQRPYPGQPVLVRRLPRPGTARRHAGVSPSRRAHHAQRPGRVRAGHHAPSGWHHARGGAGARTPAPAPSRWPSPTSRSATGRAGSPTGSRSAVSAGRRRTPGRLPSVIPEPGSPASRAHAGSRGARAAGVARGVTWPGWGQPENSARAPVRLMVIVEGQPVPPSGCAFNGAPCSFAASGAP